FYGLSKAGQLAVVDEMRTQGYLEGIQRSIGPLHYLYPDSPFDFLVHEWSRFDSHKSEIEAMKTILRPLFDKRTREAMMVQGAGVYLGFVQGRLKLATDSALCEFPELENYPMTEKSKVIASAVA